MPNPPPGPSFTQNSELVKSGGIIIDSAPGFAPTVEELHSLAEQTVTLYEKNEGAAALKVADRMVERFPTSAGVNYLRVLCLNRVGRHEEALVACEKELLVNPTNDLARVELASLSEALKIKEFKLINPEQRSYHTKIDLATLKSVQIATHNYTYRGVSMIKNPFDQAIYPLLLWNLKPRTIIEIGSKNGGSALWFGDLVNNFGLDTRIYSIDIVKVTEVSHARVTFLEGDGRRLEQSLSHEWMASLSRPLLVIEDADHSYETSSAVLRFFTEHLLPDEMIVIEDGIISDLESDETAQSGPHRALKEFFENNPGQYEVEPKYADFFGYNFTWCTNGFLRKKKTRINQNIPKDLVSEFLKVDPVPLQAESQLSKNERFQLFSAIRNLLPKTEPELRFVDLESDFGAVLKLAAQASISDGRSVHAVVIGGDDLPELDDLQTSIKVTQIKSSALTGLADAQRLFADGVRAEAIIVGGDLSYEALRQKLIYYYDLLAPGGLIIMQGFLPVLSEENQSSITMHYNGKEPGIRRACLEVIERMFKATLVEIPLLYPEQLARSDTIKGTVPEVYSTVRIYRK